MLKNQFGLSAEIKRLAEETFQYNRVFFSYRSESEPNTIQVLCYQRKVKGLHSWIMAENDSSLRLPDYDFQLSIVGDLIASVSVGTVKEQRVYTIATGQWIDQQGKTVEPPTRGEQLQGIVKKLNRWIGNEIHRQNFNSRLLAN